MTNINIRTLFIWLQVFFAYPLFSLGCEQQFLKELSYQNQGISNSFFDQDLDKINECICSDEFYNKQIEKSAKGDFLLLFYTYIAKGNCFFKNGELEKAESRYYQALEVSSQNLRNYHVSDVFDLIRSCFSTSSDLDEFKIYLRSLCLDCTLKSYKEEKQCNGIYLYYTLLLEELELNHEIVDFVQLLNQLVSMSPHRNPEHFYLQGALISSSLRLKKNSLAEEKFCRFYDTYSGKASLYLEDRKEIDRLYHKKYTEVCYLFSNKSHDINEKLYFLEEAIAYGYFSDKTIRIRTLEDLFKLYSSTKNKHASLYYLREMYWLEDSGEEIRDYRLYYKAKFEDFYTQGEYQYAYLALKKGFELSKLKMDTVGMIGFTNSLSCFMIEHEEVLVNDKERRFYNDPNIFSYMWILLNKEKPDYLCKRTLYLTPWTEDITRISMKHRGLTVWRDKKNQNALGQPIIEVTITNETGFLRQPRFNDFLFHQNDGIECRYPIEFVKIPVRDSLREFKALFVFPEHIPHKEKFRIELPSNRIFSKKGNGNEEFIFEFDHVENDDFEPYSDFFPFLTFESGSQPVKLKTENWYHFLTENYQTLANTGNLLGCIEQLLHPETSNINDGYDKLIQRSLSKVEEKMENGQINESIKILQDIIKAKGEINHFVS